MLNIDALKANNNLFIHNNFHLSNCDSNANYNFNKEKNKFCNFSEQIKNNPSINSYIYLFDFLSVDELLQMFPFILNNIDTIISNSQSFLLIDKIISLLTLDSCNKYKDPKININENIYYFLMSFFNKRIISLIHSNNYISSIINLVIKLGYPKNDFIYNEIKNEFVVYAYNRQGCILIQNLFPLGNEIQQRTLFNLIMEQYNELIVDKYGHYLFKYLLYKEVNEEKYYNHIFEKIINNVKRYTNNKYSSVVIERLLDTSNSNIRDKIIERICGNENDIVELLYHCYGNYVLQKIIKVTKDHSILGMIYKTIMKNKNSLYKLSYGKKIMKEISSAYTLK